MSDYRVSHTASEKGAEYHAKFFDNPYRSMMWGFEQKILDSVVDRKAPSSASYLDFACGTGRLMTHLGPKFHDAVGVDVAESMLDIARQNSPSSTFVNADLTRSNVFDGRKFDVITAFRFFANAQDDLRRDAMQALAAHLADNGILIFNNHKNSSSIVYAFAALIRREQRNMSHQQVQQLVFDAGLEIIESHFAGVFPATDRVRTLPVWILRWLEKMAMRFGFLSALASNRIYVCARRINV